MENSKSEQNLVGQLRWLMIFRVITTTFLLGTTIIVQWRQPGRAYDTALIALYALIGSTYFLAVIYAVILPRFMTPTVQAYTQIIGDIIITTMVIYLTGGFESIFSFMYILAVINAGILLKTRGGMIAASMSVIFFGSLLDLHYYNYIHPYYTRSIHQAQVFFQPADVLFKILINGIAFYLVAVLTGYLSQQVEESRLKLAAKESDFERLERLNESIIQSIDSGLMTLGSQGEILSLNPVGERITGLNYLKVRGRPYAEIFPQLKIPDDPGSGQVRRRSWSMIFNRDDGQEFFLELALLGLRDQSGADSGRLLVFQDKTRIHQMEEEVKRIEKLAMVGELAAGIAHEIRNPLASLSGSFQMLEADIQGRPDQERLLDIIRREMDHLSHIVNDFVMFARPRSGGAARIDLSRIVEDNLKMFERQAGLDDRIKIAGDIRPGVRVLVDPHQLEQVMWNLLHNAIEAMPDGGRLTVKVGVSPDDSGSAEITVKDTGQGIDPDDLPRIFDPFFTTKARGSGLGLSIVFRILEENGGKISVFSQPGHGAAFTVHLPLSEERPDPAGGASS